MPVLFSISQPELENLLGLAGSILAPGGALGQRPVEPAGTWPGTASSPPGFSCARQDFMRLELIGNPEITNYQLNSKNSKTAVFYSCFAVF